MESGTNSDIREGYTCKVPVEVLFCVMVFGPVYIRLLRNIGACMYRALDCEDLIQSALRN